MFEFKFTQGIVTLALEIRTNEILPGEKAMIEAFIKLANEIWETAHAAEIEAE